MKTKSLNLKVSDHNIRSGDIVLPDGRPVTVYIDGNEKKAYEGETVLTVLSSYGLKRISKNDHNQEVGAYCNMGICFCCTVLVNETKSRACKTTVQNGMQIKTLTNTSDLINGYLEKKQLPL